MTTPLWVLLAFAMWTLLVLMTGVGVRRWSLIIRGRAQIADFPADTPHGSNAYRRAVRAHANCVENLPVYAAVAVVAYAMHMRSDLIDALAVLFIAARIVQSVVHMAFAETNASVAVRFTFFFIQIAAISGMAAEIIRHA